MTKLTKTQGDFLLKLARDTITSHLLGKSKIKPAASHPILNENRGVFVTLNTSNGDLRGCIGHSDPIKPLINAVMDCAVHAATQDPRFPPITKEELSSTKIEITVLTQPKLIEVKHEASYTHEITIGKDGLIVEQGTNKGLLLPQVAWDLHWDEKKFLEQTCIKAGLPATAYKDLEKTKVYKFQGQIFKEA
ncbi:MAG: TIGR00296 family protein [Candidatus Undinarchaeales archaeon]|jgi:hypothetical protein|nr:TIGR00296 family protein [Candidatus Undinarchaeales archaeon]